MKKRLFSHLGGTGLLLFGRARSFLFLLVLSALPLSAEEEEGEIRALWVDAWGTEFRDEAGVARLIEDARSANINLIFPNLRRITGEVFFRSSYEPMAAEVEPEFDPLEALLRHARSGGRRIAVHPYIAVTPVWTRPEETPVQANHPFVLHPEWLSETVEGVPFERKFFFDLGHPGFIEHMTGLLRELVENYDIDGLQLDKIRYSGLEWGYNPVAVERFRSLYDRSGRPLEMDPLWVEFRRNLVTALVRRVYLQTKAVRPETMVSAAAICWLPAPSSDDDWRSTAAYSKVLQDWRSWLEEGTLDLVVPMSYFAEPKHAEGWEEWTRFIKDNRYGRLAALGIGLYKNPIPVSVGQIEDARTETQSGNRANGVSLFSYRVPDRDRGPVEPLLEALSAGPFAEPAALPEFPDFHEEGRGHLLVRIAGADGMPLPDRPVTLEGPVTVETRTDGNGMLAMLNLVPGTYRISTDGAEESGQGLPREVRVRAGEVNPVREDPAEGAE